MLYDLETYLFQDVHEKFEQGQRISDFDFYCIIYWKRNPSKAKIQNSLKESDITSTDLLNEVRKAETDEEKLGVLTRVKHIGPAIASAILAVCYPEEYAVVDTEILRMLEMLGPKEHLSDDAKAVKLYLEYNELCKEWSGELGISLRRMDRLLWTKAWKKRVVP